MTRIAGLLFASLAAGCASLWAPPDAPPKSVEAAPGRTPVAEAPPAATPKPAPKKAAAKAEAPPARPAVKAAEKPAAPPSGPAPTSRIAKAPSPAPAPATPATAASAPPAAAPPAASPPLDLKTLEVRLKETKAIGLMTKITLKNQVDDLLDQFRDYYSGKLKVQLADLRRPFEMLLMKVLSLLQDGDAALAKAIHASREALWGILADREKFQKLA